MPPLSENGPARAAWVLGPEERVKHHILPGRDKLTSVLQHYRRKRLEATEQGRHALARTARVSTSAHARLAFDVLGLRVCKLQHSSKAVSLEKS